VRQLTGFTHVLRLRRMLGLFAFTYVLLHFLLYISYEGFDLSGDTTRTGAGKHFGDPAVMLGFDVTYRPWNLSVDVGAFAVQALAEPIAHRGVTTNWALGVRWSPR